MSESNKLDKIINLDEISSDEEDESVGGSGDNSDNKLEYESEDKLLDESNNKSEYELEDESLDGSDDNSDGELVNKNSGDICDKCLDSFDAHRCFRCGVRYCGCDGGSYYMTIGPSEYTCTPCFDKHEERLKKSVGYRICHDGPLWIGGIFGTTMCIGGCRWLLISGIRTLFKTYSLLQIFFYGSILSFIIYKIGLFLYKDNERCKKNHEKFMKQGSNESDAEYRHRINHYRWIMEILHSGI